MNQTSNLNMANPIANLIFIPAPALGHIMSTVEMAKSLANRDQRLAITVLVIKPPPAISGSGITTYIESLKPTDRISFVHLPQHEFTPDPNDPMALFTVFLKDHCNYVRTVMADMTSQPGSTRIAGLVIDMFCACMIDVAHELNVPAYMFFICNAALLGFHFYIQTLSDDMKKDVFELGCSDTEVSVPVYVNPLPTKLFWSMVKTREGLDFVLGSVKRFRELKGIMVNTFRELESHSIDSLIADVSIPPVYPVGPVINLEGVSRKESDGDIITWLDGQPRSSVVFLCFGSMGSFDEVQVKEIARGLEQSGHRFLWSLLRPAVVQKPGLPSDYEDPNEVLPEGFTERTSGNGKVIGWAPQAAVLSHTAIGGFVSHCGWNSVLESIWFGVPLAAWPMHADSQMVAFQMVVELGLAVEMKLDYRKNLIDPKANIVIVSAKEIENGIRVLMEDHKVKTKVKEMSEKSRLAVMDGGSSYESVSHLIEDFIKACVKLELS